MKLSQIKKLMFKEIHVKIEEEGLESLEFKFNMPATGIEVYNAQSEAFMKGILKETNLETGEVNNIDGELMLSKINPKMNDVIELITAIPAIEADKVKGWLSTQGITPDKELYKLAMDATLTEIYLQINEIMDNMTAEETENLTPRRDAAFGSIV